MANVFLSYARPDAAVAERIERELGRSGRSVWFDHELPAHRAYSDVIAAELESAAAVLVIWSKSSVGSQWVRSEANRARELDKLVQARVGDARLPMPFDQIQCADLTGWRDGGKHPGWLQVCRSIDALLGENADLERARIVAPAQWPNRRVVLIGSGAAAFLVGGGAAIWSRLRSDDHATPESRLYLQKGIDALQSDDPEERAQAVPLLSQATQLSPRFAAAWGALAAAYAARKFTQPPSERAGDDARSRSAAREALELDPNEPRALGALLILEPIYRNWLKAERDARESLKHNPDYPLLLDAVADVLTGVGRWSDAVKFLDRIDRTHFLLPGVYRHLVIALWSAGNLPAADDALNQAVERWPQHEQIWRTRLFFLMHSGRANEALVLLNGPDRPKRIEHQFVIAAVATANSLLGQATASEAVKQNLDFLGSSPDAALLVALRCSALADQEIAFELLEGYYFGRGRRAKLAPLAGDEDRVTAPLFQPPARNLWRDTRFSALLDLVGLNDYWRQSGTMPDFRKSTEGA